MRRIICLLAAALFVSGLASAAPAAEPKDAALKIERVALFKNGLGYFNSSAKLPGGTTAVRFGQLPVPSHGTFWVGWGSKVQVNGLYTSLEDVPGTALAPSLTGLLKENIGRKVVVWLSPIGNDPPRLEGVIVSVDTGEAAVEPVNPYVMGPRRTENRNPYYYPGAGAVAFLKTDKGLTALNVASVARLDFPDTDVKKAVTSVQKQPSLRLELKKAAGGEDVEVSYLARGITWSPSYLIDLSDDKKARLTASALVVNEVADLDGVQLELVTGYPNIQFSDVNSPMAMSQPLSDFLRSLQGGQSEGAYRARGDVMRQSIVFNSYSMADSSISGPLPDYSTAQAGAAAEDLFLYPVADFSLKRGETAFVPLFTAEVPYEHIYTWKIADSIDANERYRQTGRETAPQNEEVWHSCRFTNSMKMPLTTAPAQFVKGPQFVGQDICSYTSAGAKATVRINRAMNVAAEQAEYEVKRTRNAAQFYGNSYDLVEVRGELKVANRSDKAINLEVTKEFSGEVINVSGNKLLTSPETKIITSAKGLKRVNANQTLIWNIEVKPGQEKSLEYNYKVYIYS